VPRADADAGHLGRREGFGSPLISFRFYVVSVTAFFLALTVGIVVGSTFVDRAIVDNLRSNINSVSNDLDARKATNDRLQGEAQRTARYIEQTESLTVAGRLPDTPVLVVAQRGVDGEAARRIVELSQQAGANAPGILWLETKWTLDDDGDRNALRDLLGADGGSRSRLRDRAWSRVTEELAASGPSGGGRPPSTATTRPRSKRPITSSPPVTRRPSGRSTTTTSRPPDESTVLARLVGSGFLSFQRVGESGEDVTVLEGRSPRLLVVVGSTGEPSLLPLMPRMLRHQLDAQLRTAVAEDYRIQDKGPGRGERAATVVGDDLRDEVSTVDYVDLEEGRVAAVLTLAELGRHRIGHYGFGKGADRLVPQP